MSPRDVCDREYWVEVLAIMREFWVIGLLAGLLALFSFLLGVVVTAPLFFRL